MAFGTSLLNLRRLLRAEVSQSLNTAQGVNAQGQYDMVLDRTQKELWESYEWPHLTYYANLTLQYGQRFYAYPADMPFDYIIKAYVTADGVQWTPLSFGINLEDYAQHGGEAGMSWPPRKWANRPVVTGGTPPPNLGEPQLLPAPAPLVVVTDPVGQLEIWPIPSLHGKWLRFKGQAPCNPLITDTDKAVLDDVLITLFASAEILAAQKSEHAPLKLQKANQFLRRHFANLGGGKRRTIALGGVGSMPGIAMPTPGIDYIPPGYNSPIATPQ
jgi:hypothetical protein